MHQLRIDPNYNLNKNAFFGLFQLQMFAGHMCLLLTLIQSLMQVKYMLFVSLVRGWILNRRSSQQNN